MTIPIPATDFGLILFGIQGAVELTEEEIANINIGSCYTAPFHQ